MLVPSEAREAREGHKFLLPERPVLVSTEPQFSVDHLRNERAPLTIRTVLFSETPFSAKISIHYNNLKEYTSLARERPAIYGEVAAEKLLAVMNPPPQNI